MIFFLATLLFLFSAAPSFASEDGCVTCHRKQSDFKGLKHNFADWKKSVHAAAGVSCAACHGGNLSSEDSVLAHEGVSPSGNPKSSVHFQKIPETCGQCHAAEFQEFKKSVHYRMLLRSGRGPNCLTCHGSMATKVLGYAELDSTCSLCHGKPTQAAQALSLMTSLKRFLENHQRKTAKSDSPVEKEFTQRYREIQRKWHSFNVTEVVTLSEKLLRDIRSAEKGLEKP